MEEQALHTENPLGVVGSSISTHSLPGTAADDCLLEADCFYQTAPREGLGGGTHEQLSTDSSDGAQSRTRRARRLVHDTGATAAGMAAVSMPAVGATFSNGKVTTRSLSFVLSP